MAQFQRPMDTNGLTAWHDVDYGSTQRFQECRTEHIVFEMAQESTMIRKFLGFDFDTLVEESHRWGNCQHLARTHIDMLRHIFCEREFGVGVNAAADAIG